MNNHFIAGSIMIIMTLVMISVLSSFQQQSIDGKAFLPSNFAKAPVVISGNSVYIAWWANETGNDELMFRASTDGGASFADKINLSNSHWRRIAGCRNGGRWW